MQRTTEHPLKAIRNSRNLTLDQVSTLSGVSAANLSMIERRLREPGVGTVVKIATALSMRELAGLLQSWVTNPGDDDE